MSAETPFPDSLCHRCEKHRYVITKTSTFIRCTVPEIRYPRQPVVRCDYFVEGQSSASAEEDETSR
jgi:hypothetical protein